MRGTFSNRGRKASGEGGIRTLGRIAPTPVFETGPIGRSGTSPNRRGGLPRRLQKFTAAPGGRQGHGLPHPMAPSVASGAGSRATIRFVQPQGVLLQRK